MFNSGLHICTFSLTDVDFFALSSSLGSSAINEVNPPGLLQ